MKLHILQNLRHRFNKGGKPDYIFLIILGIIVLFGLVALASASSVYSYQRWENTYHIVVHQILFGLLPGIVLFLFFYLINYRLWLRFNFFWLILTIILLASVFIPGLGAKFGTAKSWIDIFGFSFQPSEFAKLTFAIFLAGWCFRKGKDKIYDFSYGFIPFVFYLGAVCALVLAQPDLGTMLVFVAASIIIFYTAGAKLSHLGWLGLSGLAAVIILAFKKNYLLNRFLSYINPAADPQGIGYQINQALLAIGSGGLFGRGYGNSEQKFAYLPEVIGDSIFAIIAEELGFIIVVLVIFLFAFLMYRGFKIAKLATDEYGKYIAAGIIGWLSFQACLNIAVISGLAPLTGIPLPFISFGGTALAASLAAAGLLLNISKQN